MNYLINGYGIGTLVMVSLNYNGFSKILLCKFLQQCTIFILNHIKISRPFSL